MPADEVYIIGGQGRYEFGHIGLSGRICPVHVFVVEAGGSVGPGNRGVRGDEYGCALVYVGEILREPGHLLGGVIKHIFAPEVRTGTYVVIVYIVQNHEVGFAQVERVEGRGDVAGVPERLVEVSYFVHVVVVVAHGVEKRHVLEVAVGGLEVLGESVAVAVPVQIPGHVAEGEAVALAAGFGYG